MGTTRQILIATSVFSLTIAALSGCGSSGSSPYGKATSPSVTVACNATGSPFGGGDGAAPATAFAICTAAQLQNVQAAGFKSFILASNIDLTGVTYVPQDFVGSFDGNYHTISHLTLNGSGKQALFASTGGTTMVKNLRLTGVNITSSGTSSTDGGAAIVFDHYGFVIGCSAEGVINGSKYLGGLVVNNNALVQDSYAVIEFTDNLGSAIIGGIAANQAGSTRKSYAVSSFGSASVPGSTTGGIAAVTISTGTSLDSFWDTTVSGVTTTAGLGNAAGKTTAELKTPSTFLAVSWDPTLWRLVNGVYPLPVWQ